MPSEAPHEEAEGIGAINSRRASRHRSPHIALSGDGNDGHQSDWVPDFPQILPEEFTAIIRVTTRGTEPLSEGSALEHLEN